MDEARPALVNSFSPSGLSEGAALAADGRLGKMALLAGLAMLPSLATVQKYSRWW
jgi:hypothetical protein